MLQTIYKVTSRTKAEAERVEPCGGGNWVSAVPPCVSGRPAAVGSAWRPAASDGFVLPGALLLLVFPRVLPGTRTTDVLPLVQIQILQLLRGGNRPTGGQSSDFSMPRTPHVQVCFKKDSGRLKGNAMMDVTHYFCSFRLLPSH